MRSGERRARPTSRLRALHHTEGQWTHHPASGESELAPSVRHWTKQGGVGGGGTNETETSRVRWRQGRAGVGDGTSSGSVTHSSCPSMLWREPVNHQYTASRKAEDCVEEREGKNAKQAKEGKTPTPRMRIYTHPEQRMSCTRERARGGWAKNDEGPLFGRWRAVEEYKSSQFRHATWEGKGWRPREGIEREEDAGGNGCLRPRVRVSSVEGVKINRITHVPVGHAKCQELEAPSRAKRGAGMVHTHESSGCAFAFVGTRPMQDSQGELLNSRCGTLDAAGGERELVAPRRGRVGSE
ncbi:hypothetical protein C8F04DRAFT_1190451 [Mycena alexandri]|uniref:Uncharacterized protein n=1 Tax=Mycena alexandri TaxID=1745969 RepID=A0AAD6SF33_9AGAR|nr:hypothetical protein C8F04DRAFT_1190451 [Mycena alexandri]